MSGVNLANVYRGPATVDPPRLTLVTAPAVEPWAATDAEVMSALRLDSDDDQAFVTLTLKAARRYFEKITGLCLINQQWLATFDNQPLRQGQFGLEYGLAPSMSRFTGTAAGREIVFPRAPLVTVDSFDYLDENGASANFAQSGNWTAGNVGVTTAFGRLWLNEGADWPAFGSYPNAVRIKFTAGFGAAASAIPEEVRLALLMLTAHWYENHLPLDADGAVAMPLHLESLIEMNRVAFIG